MLDKKEDAAQPVEKPDEDKPAPSDKSTGTILPNTRSQIEMANNPVVGDIVYGSSGSPSRWDGKNWVYAGEPVGVRGNDGIHLTGEFTDGSTEASKDIIWQ